MRTAPQLAQPRRRGFTLVEILVVIGIIVILAGILVPMIGRAMRQAKQTRTAADMQSIGTALEAFKAEHGDYPRTIDPATGAPLAPNLGAAILGRYLTGPFGDGAIPPFPPGANDDQDPPTYVAGKEYKAGDAVQDAGGQRWVAVIANTGVAPAVATPPTWVQFGGANDMSDGPGIRMRPGGKKVGPYADSSLKMQGIAFVDTFGNPILYFPASTGKIDVLDQATPGRLMHRTSQVTAGKAGMKYDADDNFEAFRRAGETTGNDPVVLQRLRAMLGDHDGDGLIETANGERVVTEAPYLLWSAGADGRFGPDADMAAPAAVLDAQDVSKCDDVTNFPR